MRRRGPDSLEGWFVALICCLVSTLMFGSAGLSSMLFVASIDRYNTNRNAAAFPFILCNVLQAATGPFAGFFAAKYGERCVLLMGSILAFVGIATCFLAESIAALTALWGVVFGMGFGFSTLLLPAIINNYFFKKRSAALGICYLGSPIGFLIFPPVFEILMMKFELSGTFLILAAINMHCIPLSLFLRQPNFKDDSDNLPFCRSKEQFSYSSTGSTIVQPPQGPFHGRIEKVEEMIGSKSPRRFSLEFLWRLPSVKESVSENKQYVLNLNDKKYGTMDENSYYLRSYETSKLSYETLDSNTVNSNLTSSTLDTVSSVNKISAGNQMQNYKQFSTIYFGTYQQSSYIDGSKNDSGYNSNSLPKLLSASAEYLNGNCPQSLAQPKNIYCIASTNSLAPLFPDAREDGTLSQKNIKKTSDGVKDFFFKVYCHPIFILMSIANAIFNLQFSTLTTVIIDFARDHGIDSEYDKFIMMCLSLMGALGMMSFGWVTDGGYLPRNKFASLCLLSGSICTATLPLTRDFTALIVVLAFWCVAQASFVLLIPAIIAEYFDEDTQAVAVSACNVLCAPLYLIIPPLIGYFRDGQGSYDSIFYLLSGLSLLNSAAVFIVPCLVKTKSYIVNR